MTIKPMTPEELTQIVKNKEPLFILDVRNTNDFDDWKIEGESIGVFNTPYFDLLDGVDAVLEHIPVGRRVLVVCAKEGSSKFVAEQLVEAGREDIFYLEGGMKSWSEHLHRVKVYEDEQVKVYQLVRVGKGCLSYMVISGKEALVVDPARMTSFYEQLAAEEGVTITHIVDSHLHADHISGGKQLAEATAAKYYLMKSEGAVFEHEAFEQHEQVHFAQVHLQVLAVKTPGHTPGSVSFFVNNKLLFSGDTIFVGGLGRPDLGGKIREWAKDLYETVYGKVATIGDDVIVLPAHYADFNKEMCNQGYIGDTLGNIRKQNEMMYNKTELEFIETVAQTAGKETPPNFEEIIAINRGMENADQERQRELEIGPNRCAIHHTYS